MKKTEAHSYKGRDLFVGDSVSVHRNLNADTLTIKKTALVHGHAEMVELYNVTFSVGEKGNESVNATGVKQVHAHVRGTLVSATDAENNIGATYSKLEENGWTRVYYNPYKVKTFVYYKTFEPIFQCDYAIVIMDRVYIKSYLN